MNNHFEPIIITKEQIIAAAQLIANKDGNAWEYTPQQYVVAVEGYLHCLISDILNDADWHAGKDHFTAGKKYDPAFCDEATELVMPQPPEWAHDQADRDTAAFAPRPQCQVEPDGQIYFA